VTFYLLLIIPHILALGGLFLFAFNSALSDGDGDDESGWNDGGQAPPEPPAPAPSGGGIPLPVSHPPRRRLRDGERLSDQHLRPRRRDHEPAPVVPSRP
jgi:hypothetical protein